MTELSLSKKILSGGFWMFSLRIISQIFIFLRVTVLARILSPKDFGLAGISLLAMYFLYAFAQTGIGQALIHKKESVEDYFDTAWSISVCRGLFLFLLLFLGAPLVAKFFNNQEIIPILKILAISPLILGFNSPRTINMQKEFEFNKQFIIEATALAMELLVAIALAITLRNYWAIVFGFLAGNITRFFLSFLMFPHKPRFSLNMKKAKNLLHFGKWIFATAIISFIVSNGDNIFVGKVLGVTALGIYQVAFRFSDLLATELTYTVGQILFPAYSKIQDNKERITKAFSKTIEFIAFISLPIATAMFLLAYDFTTVILGSKWIQMVPIFKILIISGLIRSFLATGGALFLGVGKPKLDLKTNLARLIFMALSIYPFSKIYGINGVAFSVLLGVLAGTFVWFKETSKIVTSNLFSFCKNILIPIISTFIMAFFVIFLKKIYHQIHLFELILICLYSFIIYICLNFLIGYKNRKGPIFLLMEHLILIK